MVEFRAAHHIDQLWCDVHGVYVRGWAHASGTEIEEIRLTSGGATSVTREIIDRPDVGLHFGDDRLSRGGFALYLACEPFRPVSLVIVTREGCVEVDVVPPPDAGEAHESANDPAATPPLDQFIAAMKTMGGVVVEIGARVVGQASILQASRFAPECQHIGVDIHPAPGVDIHPAPGVDIVADAHRLSAGFPAGSVSGVFSLAVMEHLAMPWVVAAEINAVLADGGLVLHVVPQTFPVHEMPNDFWRMTDEALKVLYGHATGFEVVDAGMLNPVRIYHSPALRMPPWLEMPVHTGMATSYILARKIRAIGRDAVRWPIDAADLQARSLRYPPHAD